MVDQPAQPLFRSLPVPDFAGWRVYEAIMFANLMNGWKLVEHFRNGSHGEYPIPQEKWQYYVQKNCEHNEHPIPKDTSETLGVVLDPLPQWGSRKQLVTGVLAGLGGGVIAYVLFKAFG